jgi:hypothetical protein
VGKGTAEATTQQSQQSQTSPWLPAQGALQGILGGINSQIGNYGPTGAEQGALDELMRNAQGAQNYGGQATGLANDLMAGGTDRSGMLNDAYSRYQQQLNPYASGANLDPMSSPGMRSVLDTIRNDVGNSVNGQFAGAGRDLSGMNQQALGRGIAQGEAMPLLNQYNQNVQNQLGAASSLFGAGGQTAGLLSGMDQQRFGNRATGLDMAMNGIPMAQNNRANQILAAQGQARQLPLQNLGMLEGLTIPIAGLGGQSSGTSSGTQTQTMSPAQQAWGWMNAGGNLFGKLTGGWGS